LALFAALALCVGGASGHSLATTTIQVQVLGGGQVTSDGGQITCGAGSTACFYSTSSASGSVVLTANDAGAWTFDTWIGSPCSSSSDNKCTINFSGSDIEVEASFDQTPDPGTKTLDVTVTGDASGGGNVSGDDIDCDAGDTSCTESPPINSTLTMVEEPDTGYIFGGWGKDCSGTARSCVVQMNADHSVSASFRKPRLTVTVNGTGTVTGGGIACTSGSGSGCAADETADTDVTLTATPPSGGSFTGWSGACSGSNAVCTVTMSADRNVTATFSGGGGGVTPTTFPLTVSVVGDGTVTGGGLNCGAGGTNCSATLNAGTTVTLTATPEDDETFTSWGGSCSGSTATCSLTMNAARSVTATFSGGSSATVALAVTVTGHGMVTGGGISCGNGKATCAAKVKQDSTVGLTATPGPGATFIGWSGACNGRTPTCTLQMDQAKKVSATFHGGRAPAGAHAALRSVGPPIVRRTSSGYEVTLRYTSSRRGKARIRALRAGRVESALTFNAAAGRAIAGPFPVAKSGFYSFELHLGANTLRWTACLGRCGEHASPEPFTLTRGVATAVDAGALWSLTLHFRSNTAAGVVVRVYRGKQLAREVRFPVHAGPALPGALLLSPGNYRVELTATDAVGRVRTLAWYALLP
jgi:hypothetical protein